jgi:ethanolamine ammonia-lyase small subunit
MVNLPHHKPHGIRLIGRFASQSPSKIDPAAAFDTKMTHLQHITPDRLTTPETGESMVDQAKLRFPSHLWDHSQSQQLVPDHHFQRVVLLRFGFNHFQKFFIPK